MNSDMYYPAELNGEELDQLLSQGWYRMGQGLFTTDFVCLSDKFYRVFWLRYPSAQVELSATSKKILTKNQRFHTLIKPFAPCEEHELLFKKYKSDLDFDPTESVSHWLMMGRTVNVFNTYVCEIRDEKQLIGAGLFDLGKDSLMGIMNYFDPVYKAFSLGKYAILKKWEYAKAQQLSWYYPGYVVDEYSKFDYKLFLDRQFAEIYLPELKAWVKYDTVIIEELRKIYGDLQVKLRKPSPPDLDNEQEVVV